MVYNLDLNGINLPYYSSLWSKDTCRVGTGLDPNHDRFSKNVIKKISIREQLSPFGTMSGSVVLY